MLFFRREREGSLCIRSHDTKSVQLHPSIPEFQRRRFERMKNINEQRGDSYLFEWIWLFMWVHTLCSLYCWSVSRMSSLCVSCCLICLTSTCLFVSSFCRRPRTPSSLPRFSLILSLWFKSDDSFLLNLQSEGAVKGEVKEWLTLQVRCSGCCSMRTLFFSFSSLYGMNKYEKCPLLPTDCIFFLCGLVESLTTIFASNYFSSLSSSLNRKSSSCEETSLLRHQLNRVKREVVWTSLSHLTRSK